MGDPFVDWHQDLSDDAPDDSVLAEALHAHHPPVTYDPDDITTWNAAQLDELGLWKAACDGCQLGVLDDDVSEHS